MRYALITIAVFALLTPVYADEFYLTDDQGKEYGPFNFKEGEKISVAGQKFTVSKVLKKGKKTVEKMKSITIPELNFRQANIQDVIAFLKDASVEFDTGSKDQRGVSIILNAGPPPEKPDPFGGPFGGGRNAQHQSSGMTLVTFSARQISLFKAIDLMCKVADLKWGIEDGVVVIEPKKAGDAK